MSSFLGTTQNSVPGAVSCSTMTDHRRGPYFYKIGGSSSESTEKKALQLCRRNNWSGEQLPLLGLWLGLRFREFSRILQSLGKLRGWQEMRAVRMVTAYIRSGYSHAVMDTSCGQLFSEVSSDSWSTKQRNSENRHSSADEEAQLMLFFRNHGYAAAAEGEAGGGYLQKQKPRLPSTSDLNFASLLLDFSLHFVTRLISSRIGIGGASSCPPQFRGEAEPPHSRKGLKRALTFLTTLDTRGGFSEDTLAAVAELGELTLHMKFLRLLQQALVKTVLRASDPGGPLRGSRFRLLRPVRVKQFSVENVVEQKAPVHHCPRRHYEHSSVILRLLSHGSPWHYHEDPEVVVREALLTGRVSAALFWFHTVTGGRSSSATAGTSGRTEFEQIASKLIYTLSSAQLIDCFFLSVHILRTIGENVNAYLKKIATATSQRLVRWRLLKHLSHMNRLSREDLELVSIMDLLERLYPNPCYTTEFNRMSSSLSSVLYPEFPIFDEFLDLSLR
eukprot:g4750.t1